MWKQHTHTQNRSYVKTISINNAYMSALHLQWLQNSNKVIDEPDIYRDFKPSLPTVIHKIPGPHFTSFCRSESKHLPGYSIAFIWKDIQFFFFLKSIAIDLIFLWKKIQCPF